MLAATAAQAIMLTILNHILIIAVWQNLVARFAKSVTDLLMMRERLLIKIDNVRKWVVHECCLRV